MTPNLYLNNFYQSSKYMYILSHSKYVSTRIFEFFNTPYCLYLFRVNVCKFQDAPSVVICS